MSTLSQFVSNSKAIGQMLLVTETTTWSPPYSGWYYLVVTGGGGGGATGSGSSSNDGHICLGGNAGSTVIATRYLSSAVTYTLTVGNGGAGKVCTTDAVGNDGQQSSVTGTGLTSLIAKGGRGGSRAEYFYVTTIPAYTLTNAANVASTGGDVNLYGGRSGTVQNVSSYTPGVPPRAATGGGAVRLSSSISDSQIQGGKIVYASGFDTGTGAYVCFATGGAGVRGKGGGVTFSSGQWTQSLEAYSTGGGGLGPATGSSLAPNQYTIDYWRVGSAAPGSTTDMIALVAFATATGRGCDVIPFSTVQEPIVYLPGFGGGGCGYASCWGAAYRPSLDTADGGFFGGGGGAVERGSYTVMGGRGGIGGGGGGGCYSASYDTTSYSGSGGNGLILIGQAATSLTGAL